MLTTRYATIAASLLTMVLLFSPLAAADDDDDDDDDGWGEDGGEGLGVASAWLLGLSMTIVVWKPALKYIRKNADAIVADGRWLKKELGKANRWYLKAHYWIGTFAVLTGLVHGIAMDKWEWMFWAAWGGMALMSISGALLLWKWPPREVKKGARMLHAQRALLVVTVILLIVSHEVFD